MTELQVQREDFLRYRLATAFTLSRVASAAIRVSVSFWSTWLCETGFFALPGRKNQARNKKSKIYGLL